MEKQFVAGKKYKTTVKDFYANCGLTETGKEFVCHYVDKDGNCWSRDVLHDGDKSVIRNGWVVAATYELNLGLVVEVE